MLNRTSKGQVHTTAKGHYSAVLDFIIICWGLGWGVTYTKTWPFPWGVGDFLVWGCLASN